MFDNVNIYYLFLIINNVLNAKLLNIYHFGGTYLFIFK